MAYVIDVNTISLPTHPIVRYALQRPNPLSREWLEQFLSPPTMWSERPEIDPFSTPLIHPSSLRQLQAQGVSVERLLVKSSKQLEELRLSVTADMLCGEDVTYKLGLAQSFEEAYGEILTKELPHLLNEIEVYFPLDINTVPYNSFHCVIDYKGALSAVRLENVVLEEKQLHIGHIQSRRPGPKNQRALARYARRERVVPFQVKNVSELLNPTPIIFNIIGRYLTTRGF